MTNSDFSAYFVQFLKSLFYDLTLAIFTNFENLLKFPQWVSQSETILFRKNGI
jgi:hypothetical protein